MLYNQTIELVEVTKLLERVPVDTMTFQNALGHDYVSSAINITPTATNYPRPVDPDAPATTFQFGVYNNDLITPSTLYKTAYQSLAAINSTLSVKALCFFAVQNYGESGQNCEEAYSTKIIVTSPSGQSTTISTDNMSNNGSQLGTVLLNVGGTWTISYSVTQVAAMIPTATYSIYVLNNIQPSTPYTIATVIERILNAGLGNLNGYYTLDPTIYDQLNAITAPEFCITRKNLYEALLEVGGYGQVQGLPVLKEDSNGNFTIVSYDFLTNMSEWTPSALVNVNGYIDYESSQDAESYCGGIEIYADNMVDLSPGGAISQPLPMTVRTESADLVINDNAAIIPTEFPIWDVQLLEQAFVAKGAYVGNITPYVFEKSQYDNLTSYKGEFPYAKQYAFYYIQGQPNLYGLTLKPQTATDIDAATADFAAVAIAERKGETYNSSNGISAFAYKVTYMPVTTRRLRQYKPRLADNFPTSNVLFYNPTTNVADAKNLGDHAAAQLQKIGNKVRILTYKIYRVADLPRKGMTVGDEIITQVDYEFDMPYIKATIYLTKYNRLSEYIGINSQKRFYEVSEKQSVNRICNFSYQCTVSNVGKVTPSNMLNQNSVNIFANTFRGVQASYLGTINAVVCIAYDKDGNQIQSPTLHEVSANGFGKSSAFFFTFADNYSAGNQAVYCSYTPSGKGAQKLQRAVPYADELGRFYSLEMRYINSLSTIPVANKLTYSDQLSTDSSQGICDALPVTTIDTFGNIAFSHTKVIDKNGGEKISIETQFHFVTDSNYIIGNALGSRNTFVLGAYALNTSVDYTPVFVCLPYKLAYNQEIIPLDDVSTYKVSTPEITPFYSPGLAYVQIGALTNTTGQAAQSWAVVSQEDGALLIGQNVAIAAGAKGGGCYVNLETQPI